MFHTEQATAKTMLGSLHTPHSTLSLRTPLRHSALRTPHSQSAFRTLTSHSTLCTPHSALRTLTPHSALRTRNPHSARSTPQSHSALRTHTPHSALSLHPNATLGQKAKNTVSEDLGNSMKMVIFDHPRMWYLQGIVRRSPQITWFGTEKRWFFVAKPRNWKVLPRETL